MARAVVTLVWPSASSSSGTRGTNFICNDESPGNADEGQGTRGVGPDTGVVEEEAELWAREPSAVRGSWSAVWRATSWCCLCCTLALLRRYSAVCRASALEPPASDEGLLTCTCYAGTPTSATKTQRRVHAPCSAPSDETSCSVVGLHMFPLTHRYKQSLFLVCP